MCNKMYFTLVDLCLDKISSSFSRFSFAFNITTDVNIKRHFKFLQKTYSLDLLARLSTKNGLLEEYVDLLINKYLNVLDAIWLRNCSDEKVISKFVEIGPDKEGYRQWIRMDTATFEYLLERVTPLIAKENTTLERIFKLPCSVENDKQLPWQDVMCYLPNLKSLTCNVRCDNLILKDIAIYCPNIEEIDVRDSYVNNEAVENLSNIGNKTQFYTKLKKMFIRHTKIDYVGVRYLLKYIPSIEVLDYRTLPEVLFSLHKNDLSVLDKIKPKNITTLDMRFVISTHTSFGDILKVCLSACPRLKTFGYPLVSKTDIINFPKLPDLEHLYIRSRNPKININDIFKITGSKLCSLILSKCAISVSVIAESCPRIRELILKKMYFISHENDSKTVFNTLSSVTFEKMDILKNNTAVSFLVTSSKLESLSFKRCHLSSSEIKAHIIKWCEMHPLKKISFFCSYVEKECIKSILSICQTLRYLNVEGCFSDIDGEELLTFAETLYYKPTIYIDENSEVCDFKGYFNKRYDSKAYEFQEYDTDKRHVFVRKLEILSSLGILP